MTTVAAPLRSGRRPKAARQAGHHPKVEQVSRPPRSVDLVAALGTIALLAVVGFGVNGLPRILLALGFVTFAPGWAVLGHWRAIDGITRVALAVVLSLTICTAAALAMAWQENWQPLALFYGLGGMTLFALLWKVARPRPAEASSGGVVLPPAVPQEPEPEQEPESVPVFALPAPTADLEEGPAALAVVAETPAPALVQEAGVQEPAGTDLEPLVPALAAGPPAAVVLDAPAVESPPIHSQPEAPRRPTFAPEDVNVTRVSLRVLFLPRDPFSRGELTAFFAGVQERHPFTSFEMTPDDGAIMEVKGGRGLEIGRGSVEYWDAQPIAFPQAVRDAGDLLGEVQRRLGVPVLANPSCRLEARWALQAAPGGAGTQAWPTGLDERHTALLGSTGPVDVGLLLTGQSGPPGGTWQVAVGQDGDGRLSVELAMDSAMLIEDPSGVGEVLAEAYDFLTDNVARFLESVATTAGAPSTGRTDGTLLDR